VLENVDGVCQDAEMNTRTPPLIVALDVDSLVKMRETLEKMPLSLQWFKVGLELFCAHGPAVLEPLLERKSGVFLDLKLHDIPRTVGRAVKSAGRHGVQLMTIHAGGGRAMIEAAAQAAHEFGENRPKIIAVTALTSLQQHDLNEVGVTRDMADHVRSLAQLAMDAGADGVVCSPLEANMLRNTLGPTALLVTPGIRAAGEAHGDQKRTLSAGEAVRAGATHLVVGRPILEATDPAAAADRLLSEIRAATRP
jgi:orotidine-5'-phosphate decarboxylase